ncbi:MAG: hypothetical protein HFH81_02235 [Lachnospiraceae bacterium]|jgi:acyl carrier protein|nr:hypothetical protein [Lachnospiraceae bacterium]
MNKAKQEFTDIINEYSKIEVTIDNVDKLDLIEDCGFDSIQMIELICSVEDVFGIELDEDYMLADKIRNLHNFFEYIERKIK